MNSSAPATYVIRLNAMPDIVLAAVDGKVQLAWRDTSCPEQLWMMAQHPDDKSLYQFISWANRMKLSLSGYGDGVRFGGDKNWWNLAGNFPNPIVIRPSSNTDWNLNVLGHGPYDVGKLVGVWNWNEGAVNEVWQVVGSSLAPTPPMDNWKYLASFGFADKGHSLVIQANDLAGTLPPVWDGPTSFPQREIRAVFAKIDWNQGIALKSQYNNKYIYWNGPNQALGQSDTMSLRTLWTLSRYPKPNDRYYAIRPYLNSDQNINILGDPPYKAGTVVGTWDWSGGQSNESWEIGSAYTAVD